MSALLIDIGNSRIKYASAHDDQRLVSHTNDVKDLQTPIVTSTKVLLACVGNKAYAEDIAAFCQSNHIPLKVVATQPEQLGIRCAYKEYENMGVDRWLAILAVRAKTSLPVAIVSIGTAITCDFVVDNQHIGGWIAPAFELMRNSVSQNTSQVFSNDSYPKTLSLGQATQDCVNFGCLAAIQGSVRLAEEKIKSYSATYQVYINGGGQSLVSECKNESWVFSENLVLAGLKRFL